jgi:hypothetical protein
VVKTYTFDYRLDGEILYTAQHAFRDDLGAMEMARRLAEKYEVEIWLHERLLAHVNKGGVG